MLKLFNCLVLLCLSTIIIAGNNTEGSISNSNFSKELSENFNPFRVNKSLNISELGTTTVSGYANRTISLTSDSAKPWSVVTDVNDPPDGVGANVIAFFPGDQSQTLWTKEYDFDIPCNATIDFVSITLTRRSETNTEVVDLNLSLAMPNYLPSALNMADPLAPWMVSTTGWETVTFTDNTWGEVLTPDVINDPNFGLLYSIQNNDGFAEAEVGLDAVEISVCYTVDTPYDNTITYTTSKTNACEGNGSIEINAVGGSGTYEYSIDFGATWQTSNTFTGLDAGDYEILVRNTDGTCTTRVVFCALGADERILQPGDAIVACKAGGGSLTTLAVESIQPLYDFYTAGTHGVDVSSSLPAHPYEWTTSQLGGDVFSVSMDEDYNLYTGATTLYNLVGAEVPLVSKIDGITGAVTPLATLPGNRGVGGVEYVSTCDQLFVANLDDGTIYRLNAQDGMGLSTFDPLSPDNGDADLAPLGERVVAVTYNYGDGRLYYSVWHSDGEANGNKNTIRSVDLDGNCNFLPATDRLEISTPWTNEYGQPDEVIDFSMPVTDIEFSQDGQTMLLAESGYDSSFPRAQAHDARYLRYTGATNSWTLSTTLPAGNNFMQYEIGQVDEGANSRGGIDFAAAGMLNNCTVDNEQYIIGTGDALRGTTCFSYGCIYGFQFLPITGGNPTNSVLVDVARNINSQQKSVYGDMDVVHGCRESLFCGEYDLALAKQITSTGPYMPGSTVEFTITVTNEGTNDAAGIVVTDDSPAGLIYQSMTPDANVTDNNDETFTIASLPEGTNQTIVVTYMIDSGFMGTSIRNDARITTDDGNDIDSDPDLGYADDEDGDGDPDDDDEDGVSILLVQVYDLALTKAITSTGPYAPGGTVEFTITVENEGSLLASNIVVSDDSPADLTFVSMAVDANVTDNGNETFTIASLAPNITQDIVVTYMISNTFMGTSIPNNAQITVDDGDDADSDPDEDYTVDEDFDLDPFDDDEDMVSVPVGQVYDLELTKALTSTGPYSPGSTVEFTITVTNVGSVDGNSIVIRDNSPADLNFVSMAANANLTDNGDETFTIGSIASNGGTQDIVVTYMISNTFMGASLRNNAEVITDDGDDVDSTPDNDDGDQSEDDEDGVDIPIGQLYDLELTKAVTSAGPYSPGSTVEYTITVSNAGSLNATNTQITDAPPAGLTYVGMAANANVTDNGGGVFTIASLPASTDEDIVISYTIDANFMGTSLTNDAQITADDGDDIDSNPDTDDTVDEDGDGDPDDDDEDEATINIGQVYDLELTKAVTSAGPYSPGSTVEYTITVLNAGSLDAATIEITDAAPAGLTYVGMATNANVTDNGGGVFTIASLPASIDEDIVLSYTIDANFMGTSLTNDAQITADDGDDVDSNPDTDDTVDEDGDGDPDDDDEDEATINIGQVYDLELTKAVTSAGPYSPGSTVEYTITVANVGSLDAANVEVTDAAPAGLTYVGMATNANVTDNGGGVFTIASLTSNNTENIVISYTIDANFMGTTLTNDAQITADDGDDVDSNPDTDNTVDEDGDGDPDDDDEDDATINIGQVYDLELTKAVTSAGPYSPGSTVEYTITVANAGSLDAANVEVTDAAPAGLTYVGMATNANVTDNGGGVFTIASLPASTDEDIVISYTIDANFMGTSLTNDAQITADDGDDVDSNPDTDNTVDEDGDGDPDDDDEDDATIAIGQVYDLELTKAVTSTGPYSPGSTVEYTITVSNVGSLDAAGIEVTDHAPTGLTYVGMQTNANVTDNGGGVYTVASIPSGTNEQIIISYTIDTDFTGTSLRNDAEITADDGDDVDSNPDTGNDVDEDGDGDPDDDDEDGADITVNQMYDLALAKTLVSQGPFAPGDTLDFEITVTNEGNLNAANVEVTDAGGPNLIYVESVANANVTELGGGVFTVLSLPVSATETIQLSYQIDPAYQGGQLGNKAQITADDGDDVDSNPDTGDDVDEDGDGNPDDDDEDEVTFLVESYDLALIIDLNTPAPYNLGDDVTYTITVFNQGDLDANNVQVVDYIPDGFSLSANDTNGWSGPINGTTDTYENTIPFIAAGGQATLDIVLTIDDTPNGPDVENWAEISADDGNDVDSTPDTDNTDPYGGDNVVDNTNGDEDDHDNAFLSVEEGLAALGDLVWNDLNGNGRQDAGEPGVENILVRLFNDNGFLQDLVVTDANGNYLFENIIPGGYYVEFDIPSNFQPTIPFLGSDTTLDSDANGSNGPNTTQIINLGNDEINLTIDVGINECVLIGEYVWYDRNMNSVYDRTTENGINGLQVDLYRNVDGTWLFWARDWTGIHPDRTSDDGYFKFCAPPGEYYLDFNVPPTGMVSVTANQGSEENDSDITDANGMYTTSSFTVNAGESNCDLGAGFYAMGSIGDIVWLDNNANGVRANNEPAMEGVLVEAYDIHNDLVGSAITDQSGRYMIDYLRDQDYYLKFYPPAGYSMTQANAVLNDQADSDVDHSNGENTTGFYNLGPGVHVPNVDAGLVIGVALPVDLVEFNGAYRQDYVYLNWETGSEVNTDFFVIERRFHTDSDFSTIARQPAQGTAAKYNLNDYDVDESGVYYYRLRTIDKDGTEELSKVISVDIESERSGDIGLYPNPAVDKINLDINLKESKQVNVDIYNAAGQLVQANLINQRFPKGVYNAVIDITNLNAGVYNLRITKDTEVVSKQLIVLKN